MKDIKKFLVSALFTLCLSFLLVSIIYQVNSYFGGAKNNQQSQLQAGQSFIAPESATQSKPLQLDIDFLSDQQITPQITQIATEYAIFEFSSQGAILEKLTFKQHLQDKPTLMTTIAPSDQKERSEAAFLLALHDGTPLNYQLIGATETDTAHQVRYRAAFAQGEIEKTFTIDKHIHKLDLAITITPVSGVTLQPRVIFPSPALAGIADDTTAALITNQQGSVQKTARKKLDTHQGWLAPALFGSEDKYFIHAMIHDHQSFAQRAYFKHVCNDLLSIIEGPAVTQKTSWNISFYLGPKSEQGIQAVDPRLENAIEYSGWLAPLARLLLLLLNYLNTFVHNYGIAIILVTVLIKLVLLPFSLGGEKELKKRADFQKKMNYIQQKYKHDTEALNRERAELLKKHGMPGMMGCLPLLLQIPIFFALNKVLSSSIELYQAPFAWIQDLSLPDPWYILPVLLAITMFAQALWADQSQRISLLAAGLVFGALSVNFAAGLALYFVANAILHLAQTILTRKA